MFVIVVTLKFNIFVKPGARILDIELKNVLRYEKLYLEIEDISWQGG